MSDDTSGRSGKPATAASLKKVTAQNLSRLGAERLGEILVELAATRPELKRRLRMELAAEQGAEHLVPEIDRRLAALHSSGGRIGWRRRPAFVGDIDTLRDLIASRLGSHEPVAARDRLLALLASARSLDRRVRDRDGALHAVFARAAEDLTGLLASNPADALEAAIRGDPSMWEGWIGPIAQAMTREDAANLLHRLCTDPVASPGFQSILRRLADRAGDVDAFVATFSPQGRLTPAVAAAIARRRLEAGDDEAAHAALIAARPDQTRAHDPDPDWEAAWIEWLEIAGRADAAQTARWVAFERRLSAPALRDYLRRLPDFEDVEAEVRAFEFAARYADAERALAFLIEWPSFLTAAQLVAARADELRLDPETAELWAGRLRSRQPAAAERLLRKAAAQAFRRRDYATSERLTQEADAIH